MNSPEPPLLKRTEDFLQMLQPCIGGVETVAFLELGARRIVVEPHALIGEGMRSARSEEKAQTQQQGRGCAILHRYGWKRGAEYSEWRRGGNRESDAGVAAVGQRSS
jgi:hypothetical protein